jgi:hypothetical protein
MNLLHGMRDPYGKKRHSILLWFRSQIDPPIKALENAILHPIRTPLPPDLSDLFHSTDNTFLG